MEIGFTKAQILNDETKKYEKWIADGYHADMQWMERNIDKRRDPSIILEDVKNIIVTAFNYNTDHHHSNNSEFGKISRYAWGDDYHDILLPKLRELETKIIEQYPESKSRYYVDTGPVLERQWAKLAGIGWQGKNSLIINRKYGSWMFLGVILTTAEFEPDNPIKDYCGTCTKCIDACPTGAIVKPGIVDSNRCISFWTIETKGKKEFPVVVGKNLSNRIFGCDICQEVCPWNKKDVFSDDIRFAPRNDETELNLDDILSMKQEQFSARFKKSPVKRTKLTGLIKNAETAI